MGCDIHIVLERQEGSEWVGVWSSDNGPRKNGRAKIAQRDYGFFSRWGVRGHRENGTTYPRNLPKDVSRLAWLQYMRCPTDYHSVSHATLDEFCRAWIAEHPDDSEIRAQYATYDLFGVFGDEDEGEHRVVFWFDN